MSCVTRLALAASLVALAGPLAAASGPAELDSALQDIALRWETIKFATPEDERSDQMDALQKQAAALVAAYPRRAEPLIWDGILLSERAAAAGPFSALGLAKAARDELIEAEKIDPVALEAGAPASLGALFQHVPGFPIGFGDDDKARDYLTEATKLAPDGLDAWYFYGLFLHEEGEDGAAVDALRHALATPERPDRPLWNRNRREASRRLLDEIAN